MSFISRSLTNMPSERGGSWFEDFLKDFSKQVDLNKEAKATNPFLEMKIQDLKKVQDVVNQYRKDAGLELVSTASTKTNYFLSKRAAEQAVQVIKNSPETVKDIEDFAKNSGGTKDNHSIINHIREKLNDHSISFDDEGLNRYLDEIKLKYVSKDQECDTPAMGLAERTDSSQSVADYATWTGKKSE